HTDSHLSSVERRGVPARAGVVVVVMRTSPRERGSVRPVESTYIYIDVFRFNAQSWAAGIHPSDGHARTHAVAGCAVGVLHPVAGALQLLSQRAGDILVRVHAAFAQDGDHVLDDVFPRLVGDGVRKVEPVDVG